MRNNIIKKIRDSLPENYRLLYVTITGSHLYGTNSETSDTDVKFIFLPSKEDCILGRASKNININSSDDNTANTQDDVDIQGWSLQFFVELLRKGDTNAIDVLYSFTHEDCVIYMNHLIIEMLNSPLRFFDISNMRGLLGYIVSQANKYNLRGSNYKKLSEVRDLLYEIVEDL